MRRFGTLLALVLLVHGCKEKPDGMMAMPRDAGARDAPGRPRDGGTISDSAAPAVDARTDAGRDNPDGALTEDDAADALMSRLRESLMAHPGSDRVSRQAVLTELQGHPAFVRGGVSRDSSLWIRLTNGHYAGVASPRKHSSSPRWSLPGAGTPRPLAQGLPSSAQAYVGIATDTTCGFANHETMISSWLRDQGYQISTADPLPEVLRAVGDTGVFHLNTHGLITEDDDTGEHLAVFQSTMREESWKRLKERYPTEYATNEMTLMVDDSCKPRPPVGYIGYTHKFVARYMRFPQNSLVFLDACSSYDDAMVSAFRTAGASIYLGWTNTVSDDASAIAKCTLYDLMLGQNVIAATNLRIPEPAVPMRPFDFQPAWDAVVMRGLTMSSTDDGPVELTSSLSSSPVSILRPNVFKVAGNLGTGEISFFGSFGDRQGTVKVGAMNAPVMSWSAGQVVAQVPMDGEGEMVLTVGEHKSNAVPLTSWRGTISYVADTGAAFGLPAGSMTQTYECTIHLRADVHSYRGLPLNPLILSPTVTEAVGDSACTWRMQGGGTDVAQTQYSLSGGGVIRPGSGLGFVAAIDPAMRTLTLTSVSFNVQGTLTTTDRTGATSMRPIGFFPADLVSLPSGRAPLVIPMDTTWSTASGDRFPFIYGAFTATSPPVAGRTPG